jgi:uncharacterized membrane protein
MTDPTSANPAGPFQTAKPPGRTGALVSARVSFEGPLPPPNLLEAYEKVCPGAAQKILESMQVEGEHRRDLEKKSIDANIEGMRRQFAEGRLGQVFAFSIAVLFVFVGAYVALHGQPWPGALFGSAGLGGIVTSFIVGRRNQTENNEPPATPGQSAGAS